MLLSGSTFCFKHLEFLRREVSFMPDLAMLDYFYGDEAEQFTFYRIPKVLFTDPSYCSATRFLRNSDRIIEKK